MSQGAAEACNRNGQGGTHATVSTKHVGGGEIGMASKASASQAGEKIVGRGTGSHVVGDGLGYGL